VRNHLSREGWLICENRGREFCVFPEVAPNPRTARERCIRHGKLLGAVYRSEGLSRKEVRERILAERGDS